MRRIFRTTQDHHLARSRIFLLVIALLVGMVGYGGTCDYDPPPSEAIEIWDWYDLDAVRDNLGGSYILMNDLDSTTAGYEELAGPTADEGKGWQPIGALYDPSTDPFTGSFDGRGYEIRDMFIERPDEHYVGLFGYVGEVGVIEDIRAVTVTVNGFSSVGGLAGENDGTVSNCYSSGNITGYGPVGGLVGRNDDTVNNSYSTASVAGEGAVGGLVGENGYRYGTVSNSYSTGNVTGGDYTGGLVGENWGTVSDSYSTSSVTGSERVGGLVGNNIMGTLSSLVNNSYSSGNVTGNVGVGGLVGVNDGATVSNSYSTGNVTGNLGIGGLVGFSGFGTVSDSYSTGSVTGNEYVGGLVGLIDEGNISNSYSTGNVTGVTYTGGLVGDNMGTVSNSFWDTETSGQATSDGGIGKNTTEMQDIATFSGAGWDIIVVALNETNPAYIWNIANNVTYPFLSWQP